MEEYVGLVGEMAPFSSPSRPEARVSEAMSRKNGKAILDQARVRVLTLVPDFLLLWRWPVYLITPSGTWVCECLLLRVDVRKKEKSGGLCSMPGTERALRKWWPLC